jgi:hypothetical protein
MGLRKFLIILTAALVIMLIMTTWFLPLDEDFRVENPLWNGARDISTDFTANPLESLTDLPASPQGATLVLVSYLDFTTEELDQLNRFVREGGRLILADDYGHGNQVLEYLGLKTRFSGETLLDPLTNYKNKQFPRIIHLEADPLTANTESLVFNHATCLINTVNTSILASSSSFSFLDQNDNGIWEEDEPVGPLPVVYRHNLDGGQVILVADPSLFINSMRTIDENNSFIQNIGATTTSLYIDQSHLPPSELHQTKSLLAQSRDYLNMPLATAGLVTLVLIITLKPIWHKKKAGP